MKPLNAYGPWTCTSQVDAAQVAFSSAAFGVIVKVTG